MLGGAPLVGRAAAAPSLGAAISLDKPAVRIGQRVVVTLTGWTAGTATISVCGNLARRGSGDCDLGSSQFVGIPKGESTFTEFTVLAPPGTCPCVIRASSRSQDEVAVAPLEIVGVPVGPVVGVPFDAIIAVSLRVRSAPHGLLDALRLALGGRSSYAVTVSVKNRAAEVLPDVSLEGTVGRSSTDTVTAFDLPTTGPLKPGQSWTHEARVAVPAPVINRLVWRVIASGAGGPVTAQVSKGRVPVAFVLLAVILIGDVMAMIWLFTRRRIRRARDREPRKTASVPTGLPASSRSKSWCWPAADSTARNPRTQATMLRRRPSRTEGAAHGEHHTGARV